ncbi:histidinol-phosphate transaminase [Marispirochaeta sp.]|uniref:histidinol-phosphate transaminase n=1 Tax=Marispirochaeta sp. TaxID=2038653 RepID=UPI0029C60168|nr:histidinol-phosphate transaminase [Marispirochaeta sp.]
MYSRKVRALTPYVPGEQPQNRQYVKLNTNENPFPPAPGVSELLRGFDAGALRLYPDPDSQRLRDTFAMRFDLKRENIFCGNGSDEVLSHLFYAFFDEEFGPVLFPDVSYSFYPVFCSFHGLPYQEVPLTGDFDIDLELFVRAAAESDYSGIIFANPNAPTGKSLGRNAIINLLESVRPDRLVAVDEAYVDFGGESVAGLVNEYPNLLVVGTLSKSYSLAGLRLGYAAGQPELIAALTRTKDAFNSYPVSRLSQEIAAVALKDYDYFQQSRDKLIAVRDWTAEKLTEMGWQVLPSKANFLFARPSFASADELYAILKKRGFLVRHFSNPRTREFLRISIGTRDDMEGFIGELDRIKNGD